MSSRAVPEELLKDEDFKALPEIEAYPTTKSIPNPPPVDVIQGLHRFVSSQSLSFHPMTPELFGAGHRSLNSLSYPPAGSIDEDSLRRIIREELMDLRNELSAIKERESHARAQLNARLRNRSLLQNGEPLLPVPSHLTGALCPPRKTSIKAKTTIKGMTQETIDVWMTFYSLPSTGEMMEDAATLLSFLTLAEW